jgi:DNA-binding GntR family transcriptional regulator
MDPRTLHEAASLTDPVERARALTRVMTEDQALLEAAARYRRQAIADAREQGLSREQVAAALGVTPPRITQIAKGQAAKAPEAPASPTPRVLVQRSIPTPPAVRGSLSLYLVEAERQGVKADRKILYIGPEPVNEHVAATLRVSEGAEVVARRKMMFANDVPVRIATSYFRADLFANTRLSEPEFVRPSLQAALDELGYSFGRAEEFLVARRPSLFERETLDLDSDEWVVQVLRTSYSTEDTPVHALETICAATRHLFPIGQVAGADEF